MDSTSSKLQVALLDTRNLIIINFWVWAIATLKQNWRSVLLLAHFSPHLTLITTVHFAFSFSLFLVLSPSIVYETFISLWDNFVQESLLIAYSHFPLPSNVRNYRVSSMLNWTLDMCEERPNNIQVHIAVMSYVSCWLMSPSEHLSMTSGYLVVNVGHRIIALFSIKCFATFMCCVTKWKERFDSTLSIILH